MSYSNLENMEKFIKAASDLERMWMWKCKQNGCYGLSSKNYFLNYTKGSIHGPFNYLIYIKSLIRNSQVSIKNTSN